MSTKQKRRNSSATIAKPLASHPCTHDDCDRMIDLKSFACLAHWAELAGAFQLEVVEVWADLDQREGDDAANLVIAANEVWRGDEA